MMSIDGSHPFWNKRLPELAVRLALSPGKFDEGLTEEAAAQRRAIYGPNDAVVISRTPLIVQLAARFKNPLILILLAASAMSALGSDVASFVIITAVVLVGVVLDFVQEVRAERAGQALRGQVAVRARVNRDRIQSAAVGWCGTSTGAVRTMSECSSRVSEQLLRDRDEEPAR